MCFSVELHCATLTLGSQLVVQLVNSDPKVKTDKHTMLLDISGLAQRKLLIALQFKLTQHEACFHQHHPSF